jgi:hypothetical protein
VGLSNFTKSPAILSSKVSCLLLSRIPNRRGVNQSTSPSNYSQYPHPTTSPSSSPPTNSFSSRKTPQKAPPTSESPPSSNPGSEDISRTKHHRALRLGRCCKYTTSSTGYPPSCLSPRRPYLSPHAFGTDEPATRRSNWSVCKCGSSSELRQEPGPALQIHWLTV